MGRVKRLHFIGIGGSGMGGIAEVLLNIGYNISGSDIKENSVTTRLTNNGAQVMIGHNERNIIGVDAVVVSSAISEDNPELIAARENRIPIVPRAEMLAELMRFRVGIAVAGTHGKTTTTSLVASILGSAGLDPTYVIGGRLNSSARHAKLGVGQYLVAEADESDASFLYLQPMMAIVTNIDADHLSTYEGDFSRLKDTFIEFLHHIPFYGLAVMCIDNDVVKEIINDISRPVKTYGFDDSADVQAYDIEQHGTKVHFKVRSDGVKQDLNITLNMPGNHNVQNALAAICIAQELGINEEAIQKALHDFEGIGRRFQINGEIKTATESITLVDVYGHHPREVEATLQAARASWPDRRLVLAFQPHRYSRTRDLFDDFAQVLSKVDALVLTEVYAAGESTIPGAEGRDLSRAIRARGQVNPVFLEKVDELADVLAGVALPGDIILTMGAGSIGVSAKDLLEKLTNQLEEKKRGN